MGRIVIVLVVLVIGVIASPTLRARAEPHLRFALDPVYEWSARSKLADIATQLDAQVTSGRPLPDAKGLASFLETRYMNKDAPLDPWGRPYYLKPSGTAVRVGSTGRDGQRGTADDLLSRPISTRGR